MLSQQRLVRGFLGRRQAARRLEVARQQAEKVSALLSQIEGLSMKIMSQQQTVSQNDKSIPQSKLFIFKYKLNRILGGLSKIFLSKVMKESVSLSQFLSCFYMLRISTSFE